jgi:ABC-type multidrug transport system fused ATPase/permease subunit
MTVPYAGPLIFFIMALFLLVEKFYLNATRRVRFLDLEGKSPLIAEFTETATGLEHIRAYRWQSRVLSRAYDALDHSQKPVYHMLSIKSWLAFSIDMLNLLLALSVVVVAVYSPETVSESSLGHSLSLMINLSKTLNSLVQRFAEAEISFGALSRIRDFTTTTPRERIREPAIEPPASWPDAGEIVLENVTARYE